MGKAVHACELGIYNSLLGEAGHLLLMGWENSNFLRLFGENEFSPIPFLG